MEFHRNCKLLDVLLFYICNCLYGIIFLLLILQEEDEVQDQEKVHNR